MTIIINLLNIETHLHFLFYLILIYIQKGKTLFQLNIVAEIFHRHQMFKWIENGPILMDLISLAMCDFCYSMTLLCLFISNGWVKMNVQCKVLADRD